MSMVLKWERGELSKTDYRAQWASFAVVVKLFHRAHVGIESQLVIYGQDIFLRYPDPGGGYPGSGRWCME